tara:strand:- start:586 stop:957 length:372 start_codon:yes stop_codon:yes gene_type:complete
MATLTPKLTLSSTDVDPNNALDLSVTDTLTTTDPSSMISRISVSHSSATELRAASLSKVYYVYIKNIGSNNSRTITVKTAGGTSIATLAIGEWMWLPIEANAGIEVQSETSAEIVEYAYFAKS